jgi:hypothetical protein
MKTEVNNKNTMSLFVVGLGGQGTESTSHRNTKLNKKFALHAAYA